jgi:hypothetical protein
LLAFVPNPTSSGINDTFINGLGPEITSTLVQPFGITEIWDLKDKNVFEFTVPYISSTPMSLFTDAIGTLSMSVYDTLKGTSSVATYVNIMVEVFAGPDFELFNLRSPLYPAFNDETNAIPRYQSGLVESTIRDSVSMYTTGEKLLSAKQLISMPSQLCQVAWPANSGGLSWALPWYYYPTVTSVAPPPAAQQLPSAPFRMAGLIAKCYAFASGGTDVHVYAPGDTFKWVMANYAGANYGSISALWNANNGPSSANPIVRVLGEQVAHFRFPCFSRFARTYSYLYDTLIYNMSPFSTYSQPIITTAISAYASPAVPVLSFENLSSNASNLSVLLSAAEDARLAHYLGPPFLYLPSPLCTNVNYDNVTPF